MSTDPVYKEIRAVKPEEIETLRRDDECRCGHAATFHMNERKDYSCAVVKVTAKGGCVLSEPCQCKCFLEVQP